MRKIPSYITTFWNMPLLLVAVMTILGSCAEYESILNPEDVPEGMPASVTLTVQLPNMMSINRAAGITPDDEEAQHVSDLWIGFYNANSTGEHAGERAGIHYDRYDQVLKETGNSNKDHITIKNIKSLSGEYYIVAVANPSLNKGLDVNGGGEKSMLDLLNEADTWDKYKDLAVLLNGGPRSIQYSGAGLPMTGIYYDNHNLVNDYQAYIKDDDNPTPVAINSGDNVLSGCIQLRHVDAYVKFNIQVEEKYEGLISLTPVSWQIFNLPGVSYVHERRGECNAADTEINNLPESYEGATYHNSPLFEGAMTFPMSKDGVASFDFYQMENKHTGLSSVTKYNDREEEFLNEDGTNTGWYKSLVEGDTTPNDDADYSNNNASYVVIKAHLEYYCKEGVNGYEPVSENTEGAILRVADAIYTIHLGFCEGNDESSKAIDFNCRRNTKYTYNVYISGADQIRVEAKREGMTNGVEGTVTDVVGDVIKLDAHYGTFNIQLSDEDRLNLAWRIQAPFGNSTVKMMYDEENPASNSGGINLAQPDNEKIFQALNQNQFYNWIQFRPTKEKDVLADYPGDPRLIGRNIEGYNTEKILNAANGGVWYLNDLKDVVTYPHDDIKDDTDYQNYLSEIASSGKKADPEDSDNYTKFTKKRWYTVFVDEYVYEYDYKENYPSLTDDAVMDVKKAWGNFVNKDSRHVWLALSKFYPSTDAESFYANSAYIISQESIQTYYTGTGNSGKALGIEATNESYNEDYGNYVYGISTTQNNNDNAYKTISEENLPSYLPNNTGYNLTDGRFNMHNYVKSIQNKWEGILYSSPRTYGSKTYYIPNHNETFMTACLARNRDLNNDGVIDVNEIRWYLPTTENYIQLVLGAVSLRNPLFNFAGYGMDDIQAGKGADISHFAASNNRMIWAEELAATSDIYRYQSPASNFRCIRNLGLEMNQEPNPNDQNKTIGSAYTRNQGTRTIELEYYDLSGLRDYTSGHITAHSVADIRSFPSRKFQYSKEQCNKTNTQEEVHKYFSDNNGNLNKSYIYTGPTNKRNNFTNWWNVLESNEICGSYSEEADGKDRGTWRTPNISELAILHIFGNILNTGVDYISSSYEHFTNRDNGGLSTDSNPYELINHNFMGMKKTDISAGIISDGTIYLRCVRDVE